MKNSQKIITGVFSNIVLVVLMLVVFMSTIIDPASTTVASVVNGVYYQGNTTQNKVSLMINVYWGTEYIDGILKAFEDANMKTTFFIGGSWAKENPSMLNKITEKGHEIASHGYNHKDHDKLSQNENYNEIYNTHVLIKNLTGIEMNLFAPPSGAYNKETVKTATMLNYKTIMWTRDTIDWRDKDANIVYSRSVNGIKGGDLILMHPTAHTLEALPKILQEIKAKNLVCATVTETIADVI